MDDQRVKVPRKGTFIFPVTFWDFRRSVNKEEVLRLTGIAKEDRKDVLANVKQCEAVLKKFYHKFYMYPDRQSTSFFKDTSSQLLQEQLLKHGEPYDELAKKTVKKYATRDKSKCVVSFNVFEKYLANMYDIVGHLMQHDKEYTHLSIKECTHALYLDFYLKPEIRERHKFRWRPCDMALHKRLLSIPNKEYAQELRRTLPPKEASNAFNMDVVEVIELSDDSACNMEETPVHAVQVVSPPKESKPSAADVLRQSLENINNNIETPTMIHQSELDVEDEVIDVDDDSQAPVLRERQFDHAVREVSPPKEGKTSSIVRSQKTFANGASFEFPVTFGTFKRHINYDEIIKSLRVAYGQNETNQRDRDKELFYQFYCSFYVQKEVRQSHSYRFQNTDDELLRKLEEYAVPLNDMARQTMSSDQAKDETLITISGIAYRFPVSFKTFQKYINYEDLKVGLANGLAVKKKSAKELTEILGDERSCLRILRRYYLSFYTLANIRNKLEYNFNAAPPELSEKLLEWAKPTQPQVRTKHGVPSAHYTPDLDATRKERSDSTQKEISELVEQELRQSENSIEAKTTSEKNKKGQATSDQDIEERATSEKNKKADKSPPVPKKLIDNNSSKENKSRNSSELASVSEKTSNTETHTANVPNKAPGEANRNVSLSDSTKKPESSSEITRPVSDSAAATNVSHRQTKRQTMLEEAKKQFFADSSQDHKMANLICTSQGLKRSIWRILYQLTLGEFKTYTSIHNGEDLYRKDEDLHPYYHHVVDKGNWPLNLYVRLPLLRQLLHSKGVHLGRLDLGQLSPKMMHWVEAKHTDFDKIVKMQFKERTGKEIDSIEQWFQERKDFYDACWLHDHWIYKVPQITNDDLQDESYVRDLPLPDLNGIVIKSLATGKSGDGSSQTEILSINSTSDMVPDSQSCPSTQLSNTSSLVDFASVDIQSQAPKTPLDPLASQTETLASVKQEAINFLNNLHAICDTNGFEWENIGMEKQIENLDSSEEEGSSLSCFAIPKPSEMMSSYQSLDSLLTGPMFEEEESINVEESQPKESNNIQDLPEQPEEPEVTFDPSPTVTETNGIQPQVQPTKNRKKKLPASNKVPSKRVRSCRSS